LPEPVEEGFAHAVGRGAQAFTVRHGNLGALVLPANDTDLAGQFGVRFAFGQRW
jgi:hypothetical protein